MTVGASNRGGAGEGGGCVEVLDADSGPELPIVAWGGTARAIVWPGMGARLRSLHRIELGAAGETIEMSHASEAVYYVLSGSGDVADSTGGRGDRLVEGSMIHIDPGTEYVIRAAQAGIQLVGGPAPADPELYAHLHGNG